MGALDVQLGVSTWLWTSPFTTDKARDLFKKIRDLGFSMVEIPVEDPVDIDTATVRSLLDEFDLEVAVCGAFSTERDIASDNIVLQQTGMQYIQDCIRIASELGAEIFMGPLYAAVGKARMVSDEQRKTEWERSVHNLLKVSKIAEAAGITLAIEPLNRFESDMINTAADAVRMVKDVNHSSLKIALDGFHMSLEERSMEEAFVTAGDLLAHVQVAENYRGTPGTGQTDWASWKRGLEKIRYKGAVSIESFTPENQSLAGAVCIWRKLAESQDAFARDGLAFLKRLLQQQAIPKSLNLETVNRKS